MRALYQIRQTPPYLLKSLTYHIERVQYTKYATTKAEDVSNTVLGRIHGPTRKETAVAWRKPHNEGFHKVQSSSDILLQERTNQGWQGMVASNPHGRPNG